MMAHAPRRDPRAENSDGAHGSISERYGASVTPGNGERADGLTSSTAATVMRRSFSWRIFGPDLRIASN
jgi:hypothetical protein